MSKISPDADVERFARDAQNSVVHVYLKRMIAVSRLTLGRGLRRLLGLRKTIRVARPICGTGFIIRSDNTGSIVLTADHVIRGMKHSAGDRLYVRVGVGGQHRVRQLRALVLCQHREADVAILAVPALRNAQRLQFAAGIGNAGVFAVGYADPDDLFTGFAMKRDPDLSPGCFIRQEAGPIGDGVNVSHCHLDVVVTKGMSGCPIANAISNDTIFQVMKRYHRNQLRKSVPNVTDEEVDAIVNPMTIQEVVDEL